jgi:hypothetical protein
MVFSFLCWLVSPHFRAYVMLMLAGFMIWIQLTL